MQTNRRHRTRRSVKQMRAASQMVVNPARQSTGAKEKRRKVDAFQRFFMVEAVYEWS
jgi:hypothetical protein